MAVKTAAGFFTGGRAPNSTERNLTEDSGGLGGVYLLNLKSRSRRTPAGRSARVASVLYSPRAEARH